MPSRTRGIAALTLVAVLSGCAGTGGAPTSVALSEEQGFPADAPIVEPFFDETWSGEPVGWLADDRATLTIVSYGSSSCPFVATSISEVDESTVAIELRQAPAEACTDDLAPRTHVLETPEGWGQGEGPYVASVSRSLDAFGDVEAVTSTVELWPTATEPSIALETIRGVPDDITLPDDALERGEPLAYWGADRSTVRVITWGSSSCPPPARSLELVSATELAITFGPLPPIACTADFAPTTHVLEVPEGVGDDSATLAVRIEQRDGSAQEFSIPIAD